MTTLSLTPSTVGAARSLASHIHHGLSARASNTSYAQGDRVSDSGFAWECAIAGITSGSSTLTAASDRPVIDGSSVWRYLSPIDFTTLNDWAAALPGTLTEMAAAWIWSDGEITTGAGTQFVILTGHVTSPTNHILITAAPGESFRDKLVIQQGRLGYLPSQGVAFRCPDATPVSPVSYMDLRDDNVILEGIQFYDPNTASACSIVGTTPNQGAFTIRNCIFEGTAQTGATFMIGTGSTVGPFTMLNCLIIDHQPVDGEFGAVSTPPGPGPHNICNCTFVSVNRNSGAGLGIQGASGPGTVLNVTNCAFAGYFSGIGDTAAGTATGTSCAFASPSFSYPSGSFIDGGGNVFSVNFDVCFAIAPLLQWPIPLYDFRLAPGSALHGAGTTASSVITTSDDIAFDPRGTSWDIGCWQQNSRCTGVASIGPISVNTSVLVTNDNPYRPITLIPSVVAVGTAPYPASGGAITFAPTLQPNLGRALQSLSHTGQVKLLVELAAPVYDVPIEPKPAYLTPVLDPLFMTKITRITGNYQDPLPAPFSSGGWWGADARHEYSTHQPWNASSELLLVQNLQPTLGEGGGPAALSSVTWSSAGGGTVTATTATPWNLPAGQTIRMTIAGVTPSGYNGTFTATSSSSGAVNRPHYAPNHNVVAGVFGPGADGFTLADVSSVSTMNALPAGVKGLVFTGYTGGGADATFQAMVSPYIGNPKLYGFYLADEPDITNTWGTFFAPANLKAQSDWIHAHVPGAITFIVLGNQGTPAAPDYTTLGGYTPANTDIDYFGLDPYPVRSDLPGGFDMSIIDAAISAAIVSGVPLGKLIPVYQAFGGGSYAPPFDLPTPTQAGQIIAHWDALLPAPVFDMAYSWGTQVGDTAMETDPSLAAVFAAHNASGAGSFSYHVASNPGAMTVAGTWSATSSTRVWLDGTNYGIVKIKPSNYPDTGVYEERWHPRLEFKNIIVMMGAQAHAELIWYDISAEAIVRTWDLSGSLSPVFFGNGKGNITADGRLVLVFNHTHMCIVDMDAWPTVHVGPVFTIPLTDGFPHTYHTTWATISPSGKFVDVHYDTKDGAPGDWDRVFDVNGTTLAITVRTTLDPARPYTTGSTGDGFVYRIGHSDFGQNPFSANDDVLIGQEEEGFANSPPLTGVRTVPGGSGLMGHVVMVRLRDGQVTSLTDGRNEAFCFHVSCRNTDQPGWCYVTYWWPYSHYRLNGEVAAVSLDGAQNVKRLAHLHTDANLDSLTEGFPFSVTYPTWDYTYRSESHCVPSRDGNRVMFASNWFAKSSGSIDGSISGFIADTQVIPVIASVVFNPLGPIFFVAEIDALLPQSAGTVAREGWMSFPWGAAAWGGTISLPAGGFATTTIRVSDMGYRTLPTDPSGPTPYPPYMSSAFQINRQTLVDPTRTAAGAAWGQLSLAALDGHWDSVYDIWNTDARQVRIWWGNKQWDETRGIPLDPSFSDLQQLFVGYAAPWVMSVNTLDIPLRDPTYWLDKPLQADTYLGDGSHYEGSVPIGSPILVSAAHVNVGGTGYGATTTFNATVSGGSGTAAVVSVTTDAGGIVVQVNSIVNAGLYSVSPATTNAATTGGSGTGLTLDLTTFFLEKSPLYQVTKPKARGGTPSDPIRNISPALIDDQNLIYQYNDGPGTVVNLREGGVTHSAGPPVIGWINDGDVADLYAASPAAGHFVTSNARGMVRLGSLPASGFAITADVTGEFPTAGAVSTAVAMARALMIDDLLMPSTLVDSTNFANFDASFNYTAGVYFEAGNSLTGADAVSAILNGTGLRMAPSRIGLLKLFALISVNQQTTPADIEFTEANIISVTPSAMPNVVDPPPYRIRISYKHNYTRQAYTGLLPTADSDWRQYVTLNTDPSVGAVSDAVLLQYVRPNDPPQIQSALLKQTDAQTVANTLIGIYSIRQRLYTIEVPFQIGILAEIGQIAFVRFPFADIRAGKKGIIVAEQFQADQQTIKYDIMIPTE